MTLPTDSAARPATGTQYELNRGDATAVITTLAAGLRLYQRAGVALTESYAADHTAPGAAGITLAPWANRVDGGRWTLDGAAQQLDITEVERNNAIHGLLRNTGYAVLESSSHSVLLEAAIYPQHGYPLLLRHQVRYSLLEDLSLSVEQTVINDSAARAPYVLGAHPYFRLGGVPTEDLTLTVSAGTQIVANERLIPTGSVPVDGAMDLRSGRQVGELDMDTAFTDLEYRDGRTHQTLQAPDGRSVTLWHDATAPYVHVFVSRTFPGRAVAVALEPMTGPANAFNSGEGLGWLEPGAQFTMRWGIFAQLG